MSDILVNTPERHKKVNMTSTNIKKIHLPIYTVQRRSEEGDFKTIKTTQINTYMVQMIRQMYESGMSPDDYRVIITFKKKD